jgi:hypothetical protein
MKKVLPFPSTHLCETALSRYDATKTNGNRLNAEHNMRGQPASIGRQMERRDNDRKEWGTWDSR